MKKGELTSQQLVTIIILIISFVIILIFFLFLRPKDIIGKETCRNSVILSGTTPFGKETVKLKCETQDICISAGGECKNYYKDTKTIEVRSKEEVYKTLAESMYDCWWMMGEGKVDYRKGAATEAKFCVICNTISFDEKSRKLFENEKIPMEELYKYMENKKVPNTEKSYINYLYNVNSLDAIFEQAPKTNDKGEELEQAIDTKITYALVTSIVEPGWWRSLFSPTGGAVIGAFGGKLLAIAIIPTGPAGWGAVAVFLATTAIVSGISYGGSWAGVAAESVAGGKYVPIQPIFVSFDQEGLSILNCRDFDSLI